MGSHNQLTGLPDLPNSLRELNCYYNNLISLPNLPDSLRQLICHNNELEKLPEFKNHIHINFYQDKFIEYIPYNEFLKLYNSINKINIIGYQDNPITNQEELNKYMIYIKNYQRNRIKSARK